jgi:hypothetical protein
MVVRLFVYHVYNPPLALPCSASSPGETYLSVGFKQLANLMDVPTRLVLV